MWWLDPGKEVLNIVFNRVLAPYVENMDMSQVSYGIAQGELTLRNLRMKRGALDKFRLPVDVTSGHLGTFSLHLHWRDLGNKPVEVVIEDVYLLVQTSAQNPASPEEDEQRAQAAKAERLENAELLQMRGQGEVTTQEAQQNQGLIASLTAKILNNLQITVKNIHIRYEDNQSVPGHPFAAGITLAGFTAVSTNGEWEPAFIEGSAGSIHKLAKLESLALYFDTDAQSLARQATITKPFAEMISKGGHIYPHQYILKPVTGEGRIIMNHQLDKETPQFDVQLLFNEIGFVVDDNQYRDVISLVDMFHFYARQHEYRKFRPEEWEFDENRSRALLKFAGRAIMDNVHEKNRKWTWSFFKERRDDRNLYVGLFKKKLTNALVSPDLDMFQALERKLSYEDIRFYRSIARSRLKKDLAAKRKLDEERQQNQVTQSKSWSSWIWGSSSSSPTSESTSTDSDIGFGGTMTEQQRKELYEALDYDEKTALAEAFITDRDALKARVTVKLKQGSFALKRGTRDEQKELISLLFDGFRADLIQRPDNFDVSLSLRDFRVFDGTTPDNLYNQIVHVKGQEGSVVSSPFASGELVAPGSEESHAEPFLSLKFEQNPLDERADYGFTLYMRSMEIIYHKGYVEAVYDFFRPPESQLQSVEALLSVASESLEGLRQETRAGLEFALQTHKTVDVRMNMHAPIIIVPESVKVENCRVLVVDAGQISIESNLADKSVVREIYSKRNQQYTDADYRRLESLMYDNFFVKFQAAQFLIGDSLQACRRALESDDTVSQGLHVLESINIDFSVQNSIMASVPNLPRLKVGGRLPNLRVNFSDTKYKALMGLIDVAIPHFGEDEKGVRDKTTSRPQKTTPSRPPNLPLSSGLFSQAGIEYNLDEHDDEEKDGNAQPDNQITSTDETDTQTSEIRQHKFEFSFQVDALQASISKSTAAGTENLLADIRFNGFAMAFVLTDFDMTLDLHLKSFSVNMLRAGMNPIPFVSSAEQNEDDADNLMTLAYKRIQKTSPDYESVYEGIDQSVDIRLSTFIFQAEPEPVVSMYDFIMTTFTSDREANSPPMEEDTVSEVVVNPEQASDASAENQGTDKIRVIVRLASVQAVLLNDGRRLATLSLSVADVTVMLWASTLQVAVRLGSLAITDDSHLPTAIPEFKQILSFEGDELAELKYQTYGPEDTAKPNGAKSSIHLRAGSLKFCVLEQPLHDIYLFLAKLARLKGLYDAATQAAVQRASEIDRMCFDISVKSPILVFPADASQSRDVMSMRLGEIITRNSFEGSTQNITALLQGIQLTSTVYHGGDSSTLKIIDDVQVSTEVVQTTGIDRSQQRNFPDYQVVIRISDVNTHLTETQYCRLITLSQSIVRIFQGAPEGDNAVEIQPPSRPAIMNASSDHRHSFEGAIDLKPELSLSTDRGDRPWTSVDLVLKVNAVKLYLYDSSAQDKSHLKDHGIARFALNDSSFRCKMLSDGALEAELTLKSFTMSNTRPGLSKFREMIPAAKSDRNQFILLFTMSGGPNSSSVAIITVDTPHIVLAIDPLFALMRFFLSPFQNQEPPEESSIIQTVDEAPTEVSSSRSFDVRFDLHDVSISILESDTDHDSQAIRLSIKKINLSQQGILALTVERLAMSLLRMGHASDSVRFLDDLDVVISLDSRKSTAQDMIRVEVLCQPIVLRASYRDINLITSIVNKMVVSSADSAESVSQSSKVDARGKQTRSVALSSKTLQSSMHRPGSSRRTSSKRSSVGTAKVIISREHLKAKFDGFRLVLISDMHEIPMFHLETKPFALTMKDWSAELHASTSIATTVKYWNLKNSHWEPIIDPWTFSAMGSRDTSTQGINVSLTSKERLDINLSTSFMELALAAVNTWTKEGNRVLERARGSYAQYRVRNRTGGIIQVWSDTDGSTGSKDAFSAKIAQGQTVDWRFDDWRTMREHVSSSGHNALGVQFEGKPWEQLRSIPVDREGEYIFSLRPKSGKLPNKLVCEVMIEDNVKVVTFRSTYKIENQTLYRLEIALVDRTGQPVYAIEKIAPGKDYALPIEAVARNRIRIQPDQGFGYRWCSPINWEDLMDPRHARGLMVRCPHADQKEAPFRFQIGPVYDPNVVDYPKLTLKLRAPLELENLLPYNVRYTIFDRDTNQTWSSYLRQGGLMPIHSVELNHLILLSLSVQDADFQPSDFSIINTDGKSDFSVETSLSLPDSQGRKLGLRLNYLKYPNSGGAFKVQFYSPYIVVNKTGLPFSVRAVRSIRASPPVDVAGLTSPDAMSKPTPLMLSHYSSKGNEFIFQVGDSLWSKAIGFEAPSAESAIVIPSQSHRSEIHVGITWGEGLGKYKLSKVITLAPRFYIKNNLDEPIFFREHGVPLSDRSELRPGDRSPLHYTRLARDKLLTLAYLGLDAVWSQPINIEDIGAVHCRMRRAGSNDKTDPHLIVADVALEGATIFVSLSRETGLWPFIVENDSDHEVAIGQMDEEHDRPQTMYSLQPHSKMPYAWDFPAARDKKIYLHCGRHARRVDIMEIGNLPPLRLQSGTKALALDVRADGSSQRLSITNYEEETSIYKLKRRDTGTTSRQGTISSGTDFEAVEEETPPNLSVNVDLEGLGISLINQKLVEIVYFSIRNMKFEYTHSQAAQSFNLACGMIQIDNQVHDAYFPVLLQPTPVSKQAREAGALPTLQASVILLNDSAHGVLFIKYASILFQALTIQVDEAFLYAMLELTKLRGVSWEAEPENVSAFVEHPTDVPEPSLVKSGQDVYFEVLELQPIVISVSFVRNITTSDDSEAMTTRSPVAVLLNALTMTLGNLEDARLELNALGLKDVRLTLPEIQSRIIYHYRQEVLRQLYRILGSADFLGNPVGLFTNVSSGVADIFYEPWHGVVMHGNKELGIGIAKGAASFVKKTVFGVSDSVTKVTSSLGKGLSAATFDPEYQTRRTMIQRRNKPRHAIYGVTAGMEAFASSVASGAEGVIMKPFEGAESEGALGFFKGMGKGIVGAVTKPVVGVFDLASNVSEGIRNTTTVFDTPQRDRVRKPRLVPSDGVLRSYSAREALGQYWLKDLENGEYRREYYVAHISGDDVVLLTQSRVLSFWSTKLRLIWDLPLTMVQGVTIEDTGIRFASKAGRDQDRFVHIQDKSSQTWFFNSVASVVKTFNAQRRLER